MRALFMVLILALSFTMSADVHARNPTQGGADVGGTFDGDGSAPSPDRERRLSEKERREIEREAETRQSQ